MARIPQFREKGTSRATGKGARNMPSLFDVLAGGKVTTNKLKRRILIRNPGLEERLKGHKK